MTTGSSEENCCSDALLAGGYSLISIICESELRLQKRRVGSQTILSQEVCRFGRGVFRKRSPLSNSKSIPRGDQSQTL